jgi:hypothetical protein
MEIKGGGIYGGKCTNVMDFVTQMCCTLKNKDVASILISRGHKYQAPSHSNDLFLLL